MVTDLGLIWMDYFKRWDDGNFTQKEQVEKGLIQLMEQDKIKFWELYYYNSSNILTLEGKFRRALAEMEGMEQLEDIYYIYLDYRQKRIFSEILKDIMVNKGIYHILDRISTLEENLYYWKGDLEAYKTPEDYCMVTTRGSWEEAVRELEQEIQEMEQELKTLKEQLEGE